MSVERRGTVIYPMFAENSLMMSIQALERTSISSQTKRGTGRPGVRAATLLGRDSSTEVIDVNRLSQRSTSIIQYVEVADAKGRLYCVDGLVNASCWLKIVAFAKDCQSSNVELTSTENGVVLKTIKCIHPGEPLLMWFNQNILAMMNMPFLTPSNIQGQNRYTCHICNNHFEYPNPLKLHLVLKCNRWEDDHIWNILAKEFIPSPRTKIALNLFPQNLEPFRFELTGSPRTSPTRTSPVLVELPDSSATLAITSTTGSSTRASPTSSTERPLNSSDEPSPSSSTQVSPSSSTQISPVRHNIVHRGTSAFRPYSNNHIIFNASIAADRHYGQPTMHARGSLRNVPPSSTPGSDSHEAQMESIVSNLGKSTQGHLCIYCGKIYSRKYGLKIHIRTHTGYKPLRCKYCMRPFGDPSNLNKHVRLHADGETPYRCELCGKILVRRRDLDRHMRSRHQENAGHASDTSSDDVEA